MEYPNRLRAMAKLFRGFENIRISPIYRSSHKRSQLWDERYMGEILMFSNPRDSFAIALKQVGILHELHQ